MRFCLDGEMKHCCFFTENVLKRCHASTSMWSQLYDRSGQEHCVGGEDPLRLSAGVWCCVFSALKPIPVLEAGR